MEILAAFILFLTGLSFGSFLNVVADRVPRRKSIVSPPSHCFHCGHPLGAGDLIPVVSYISLRGKCRYCGGAIPARSLAIELITGIAFALAWIVIGAQWQLLFVLVYFCILIVLSINDLENGFLNRRLIYPSVGVVVVITLVKAILGLQPDIISAGLGFASGFGFFLIIWYIVRIFKREAMGFGDVVAAGLIGIIVGFPLIVAAICLAVATGGAAIVVLLIFRIKKVFEPVPITLFLAVGAMATLLWGSQLFAMIHFI